MKITLPEGFQIPQGVKEGEPFEAVATITQDGEGGFTISALDGVKLPEEQEEAEVEIEMEAPGGDAAPAGGEEVADPEIRLPFGEGM